MGLDFLDSIQIETSLISNVNLNLYDINNKIGSTEIPLGICMAAQIKCTQLNYIKAKLFNFI